MARPADKKVFKRDTILFNWLREHKGEGNKVTAEEVQKFLMDNGYSVMRGNIGSLINKIMYERNAPICFSNTKGYYWATSRAELEKTIADLESRRNSLQEHIDHLKGFMI